MASSVDSACAVWDTLVEEAHEVVADGGDAEHLRPLLGDGPHVLKAGELVWLTDRTPHEALPCKDGVYRQFFRLVTPSVSSWFAQHSTPNRLGCQPGPGTQIVVGDKFDNSGTLMASKSYALALQEKDGKTCEDESQAEIQLFQEALAHERRAHGERCAEQVELGAAASQVRQVFRFAGRTVKQWSGFFNAAQEAAEWSGIPMADLQQLAGHASASRPLHAAAQTQAKSSASAFTVASSRAGRRRRSARLAEGRAIGGPASASTMIGGPAKRTGNA